MLTLRCNAVIRPSNPSRRRIAPNSERWVANLLLFYGYFHAETGRGLGAAHQTGWTGLLANLVMRRYRKDIPELWSRQSAATQAAAPDLPGLRVA